MSTENLQALIEAFYEGEISRDDELLLFEYFNKVNLPKEFEEDKKLFLALYEQQKVKVPSSLEANLIGTIDNLNKKERKKKTRNRLMFSVGIAASIAILVSVGLQYATVSYKGNYDNVVQKYNLTESQFSESDYLETEKALLLLSTNFNEGIKQLGDANHKLLETNNALRSIFNLNK